MIFDSAYWKDDLLRRSFVLRRYMVQKRWPGASFAKIEQTVMIGFYSIRKLVEAAKLTDALIKKPISIRRYPPKGSLATRLNRHKVDELYDLGAPEKYDLPLMDLCHQFVHSYIFAPVLSEGSGLSAIWIASDRQRAKGLFEIDIEKVINVFEKVGNDEVQSMRATFDAGFADYWIDNHP